MHRHNHLSSRDTQHLSDVAHRAESQEIRWHGLDTHLRDQDGARRLCDFLVLASHAQHPRDLARHVHVVRAILGAGFDGWLAVGGVGTDGGEEDGGFAGEVAELGFVEVADFDG